MRRSHSLVALFLSTPLAFIACSDPVTPPVGSGGSPGSGGVVGSGGAPLGSGGASGGAPAATGGSSSGGASTGGAGTGGAGTGGAGTGGAGTGGAGSGGAGSGGDSGGGEFTLTSSALAPGAMFPDENTCVGGGGTFDFGLPLPFTWEGVPAGTTHLAMVMLDDTLVGQSNALGYHSAFWNMPVSVTSLPAEFGPTELMGADVINGGYLGPCPGGDLHDYTFTLYALDAEITLGSTLNDAFIQSLEDAMLDFATLSGQSDAQ